jgi:hypothetical protein
MKFKRCSIETCSKVITVYQDSTETGQRAITEDGLTETCLKAIRETHQ